MAQARYITVVEFAEAFDSRLIAQLGSDSGTAISDLTVAESDASLVRVVNAIERASGMVESYALRGEFYTLTSLATLQAADDWALKGLVANLAYVFLVRRRGNGLNEETAKIWDDCMEALDHLGRGRRIFNDSDVIDAGKPAVSVIDQSQRDQLGLVSDSFYFPRRQIRVV